MGFRKKHKAAHQQVLEAGKLERKPHSNLLTSAEGDSEAKKRQKEASHCLCSLSNTHARTHAHTLVSQRLKDRATVIQYSPDPGLYKGLTFYTDKGLSSGLGCVTLLLQEIMHVCVFSVLPGQKHQSGFTFLYSNKVICQGDKGHYFAHFAYVEK